MHIVPEFQLLQIYFYFNQEQVKPIDIEHYRYVFHTNFVDLKIIIRVSQ